MANTFYFDACSVDSTMTPYPDSIDEKVYDKSGSGLTFHTSTDPFGPKLMLPHSIMNENVAINYRNIYNGFPFFSKEHNFTEYSDYLKCMQKDGFLAAFLQDKKNPTYKNIIHHYNSENFDPLGLAKYRMQDFIYLKYYNQIPNNYMITLRRYSRPCEDHMFGLDMDPGAMNNLNNYEDDYFALATAVTYMGDKAGNKLSDILKFDYGAKWADKEGKVQSLKNPDGGLAAQLKNKGRVGDGLIGAVTGRLGGSESATKQSKGMLLFAAACMGKGVNVSKAMSSQHQYEGNTFDKRYGEEFWGDVNVVNSVKMRSRGLTFSNSFSLNFEYSLKSLKCVNPRIAMMDILSNFLILTGNYGSFWGGATIFYGNRNIAPQYGDPNLLRNGQYGKYIKSLVGDVKEGFKKISQGANGEEPKNWLDSMVNAAKNVGSGFLQGLVGNLLGGDIGVAGEADVPQALLSGKPSGFWHVTIGNPLDPIAMMGNMAVTKTTVQFGDALGYDDFPTEIKFTVELEHCRPRENSTIESMFNAGKGRFYSFTDDDTLNAFKKINHLDQFVADDKMTNQSVTTNFDPKTGKGSTVLPKHNGATVTANSGWIKQIGAMLNG